MWRVFNCTVAFGTLSVLQYCSSIPSSRPSLGITLVCLYWNFRKGNDSALNAHSSIAQFYPCTRFELHFKYFAVMPMYVDSWNDVPLVGLMIAHLPDIRCLLWTQRIVIFFNKEPVTDTCRLVCYHWWPVIQWQLLIVTASHPTRRGKNRKHLVFGNTSFQKMWCILVW